MCELRLPLLPADDQLRGSVLREMCCVLPAACCDSHANHCASRGQILEKIDKELRGADDLPSCGAANALAGAVCLEQLDSAQVRLEL